MGGGWGGSRERDKKERSSEARENLVILRTAASLMDSVCVRRACQGVCVCVCMCLVEGVVGGGSAGKGCVYPICSLPLPCGRKNHWPALSLIPEDTETERQAQDSRKEREREREK